MPNRCVRSGLGGGRRRRSESGPRSVGQELPVSVLFADIRGFTGFAEALLPYDVIHVLQRHFHEVTASIERHSGVVTSYMGDGIMALFGPNEAERSALRAARAGLRDAGRRRPPPRPTSRRSTAAPSTSTSACTTDRPSSAACGVGRRP